MLRKRQIKANNTKHTYTLSERETHANRHSAIHTLMLMQAIISVLLSFLLLSMAFCLSLSSIFHFRSFSTFFPLANAKTSNWPNFILCKWKNIFTRMRSARMKQRKSDFFHGFVYVPIRRRLWFIHFVVDVYFHRQIYNFEFERLISIQFCIIQWINSNYPFLVRPDSIVETHTDRKWCVFLCLFNWMFHLKLLRQFFSWKQRMNSKPKY